MSKKIFPAHLDHLYSMLNFIHDNCRKRQMVMPLLDKIILAVEEALVNIINYGYPNKEGTIEITCEDPGKRPGIKIVIKDQGVPFNPVGGAAKPTSPEEHSVISCKLGGYGIYIFVGIMDRVEYQRLDDGNSLSLTKYL